MLVLAIAIMGGIIAIVGSLSLSYRQARQGAIESMEAKTSLWAEAAGIFINTARQKLAALDAASNGMPTPETIAALRKLVVNSPMIREAWLVRGSEIVCTDTGVVIPSVPVNPALDILGRTGDIKIIASPQPTDRESSILITYNTGKDYHFAVSIPTQFFADMMKYGDRNSDHTIFFLRRDGTLLDQSLSADALAAPPAAIPATGLSETRTDILYTRPIPGHTSAVIAVLPKKVLGSLWLRNLPLYGGLAAVLAFCIFLTAWVVRAQTLSLESELREAARLRQIVAHYQPILNLQTGKCDALEVLMRWQHPKRGLIPPLAFIPEAERTGVITELTECLMVRALEELTPIFKAFPHLHAAINIPVQTLTNPSFPAHVDRLIQGRFSYKNISFELTESTSLAEEALVQLRTMKDLGIRLAVDDFGTGYSNLRYLSLFPFDFLKVDKAFVDVITNESRSSGLVDQIVSIGRACGLTLIAEGIEHPVQVEYLRRLGVEFGQGFYFAAPMPIEKLSDWMAKNAEGEIGPLPSGG